MRWALDILCRLVIRIFFRRVEVVGEETLPEGGILLAPNHPSGLMDPLFVFVQSSRPTSFLAKAPLFDTFLVKHFVRAFEALPVYREQDGFETNKNRETLTRAAAVLARGGAIAMFPEGKSHDEPRMSRFKTGAARIALGGRALGPADAPVHVVPAGIFYSDKRTFRSDAMLVYGRAIPVPRVALDAEGEPSADAVLPLTESIRAGLEAVVIEGESRDVLALAALASALIRGARRDLGERASLPELGAGEAASDLERERRLRRLLVEQHAELTRTRGPEIEALTERMRALGAALAHHGIDPADPAAPARAFPGARAGLALFALALSSPLALLGVVFHYPVYRFVGFLAARLARRDDATIATMKMLAGLLFFPLSWLLAAIGVAIGAGPLMGLAAMLVLPLSALVALHAVEVLPLVLVWTRAVVLSLTRADAHARLVRERAAIYEALVALQPGT